jgi:glutathione S-transferase
MITIYSYKWVPDMVRGLVRDLRVRWALEEAGLDYQEWLIGFGEDQDSPAFRACQPYGQIPVYEEDGLVLFESGAIVQHIGEKSEALLPRDPAARARAICWLFSALNSVEPFVQQLCEIDLFHGDARWAAERRPQMEPWVKRRLSELAAALGDKDYLEGQFTVGDLMMATVLRNLRHTELVAAEPVAQAYLARCEARPAFQRALADHLASFQDQAA